MKADVVPCVRCGADVDTNDLPFVADEELCDLCFDDLRAEAGPGPDQLALACEFMRRMVQE
jgi:hypothetical protein